MGEYRHWFDDPEINDVSDTLAFGSQDAGACDRCSHLDGLPIILAGRFHWRRRRWHQVAGPPRR
jgi:hypothetical protein